MKIEMIFALSDRGMVNSSPDPKALKLLFDPYVQRWADYHRRAGHEVPVERQVIIEQSFSHLAAIAEGASEGSFIHRVGLISEIMSNQKPPCAPEI